MTESVYRSAALVLRYPVAAAGLFIALRALYMFIKDTAKAAGFRREAGDIGAAAVLHVLPADRSGEEMKFRIYRGGSVGSGAVCDVRLKKLGLKKTHFDYEISDSQMRISRARGARVFAAGDRDETRDSFGPGEKFVAGKAVLYFRMIQPGFKPCSPAARKVYGDGWNFRAAARVKPAGRKAAPDSRSAEENAKAAGGARTADRNKTRASGPNPKGNR